LPGQELAGNELDVLCGLQTPGDRHVDFDEMSEIAKCVPLAKPFYGIRRQRDAMPLGKCEERPRLDGPLEMNVKFNFWHLSDEVIESGHVRCNVVDHGWITLTI
jgi:hypothetical protein